MLIYNGKGFIPGIPARDLSDADVEKYGGEKLLLETGLFEKPLFPKQTKKDKKDDKEGE